MHPLSYSFCVACSSFPASRIFRLLRLQVSGEVFIANFSPNTSAYRKFFSPALQHIVKQRDELFMRRLPSLCTYIFASRLSRSFFCKFRQSRRYYETFKSFFRKTNVRVEATGRHVYMIVRRLRAKIREHHVNSICKLRQREGRSRLFRAGRK